MTLRLNMNFVIGFLSFIFLNTINEEFIGCLIVFGR